jgi:hypothetical protein
MAEKRRKKPPTGSVKLSLTLVPGTEEFRAYTRIQRKYLDEINKRQKEASDDVPCKVSNNSCDIVRGSLFALDEKPQEELPNYMDAAWKPKGRQPTNTETRDDDKTDSDAKLDEQATLLH